MENSPCIDSGINYFDFQNGIIIDINVNSYNGEAPDMGAYEFIPNVEECESFLGDINSDQVLDILDILSTVADPAIQIHLDACILSRARSNISVDASNW